LDDFGRVFCNPNPLRPEAPPAESARLKVFAQRIAIDAPAGGVRDSALPKRAGMMRVNAPH